MNELLAIIVIVVVCCAIFCAWLLSMATCPDKMVDWLNGTTGTSTCSTSYESKELIDKNNDKDPEPAVSQSSVFLQLGKDKQQAISKKLSVVPEQDEQLTVTSISQIIYPSVHKEEIKDRTRLETYFENNTPDDNMEVVIHGVQPSDPQSAHSYQGNLADLPVRYHYSAPVIHVV